MRKLPLPQENNPLLSELKHGGDIFVFSETWSGNKGFLMRERLQPIIPFIDQYQPVIRIAETVICTYLYLELYEPVPKSVKESLRESMQEIRH